MAKRFYWLRPIVCRALLLPVLVSLSVAVVVLYAQDDAKDVLIDQPADKVEDVFDDTLDLDDDDVDDVYDDDFDKSDAVPIMRHKTSDTSRSCGGMWTETIARGMTQTPVAVKLDDLLEFKEDYYGKTVTVDGEMHRSFRDGVFTIEDDDFFNDDDLLVINDSSSSTGIIALNDSLEKGKNVRVTGVIRPYDRGELECEYGPLDLESREGHSFTKGPVLVIADPLVARVEPPPILEKPSAPAIMPPPPPEPIPPAPYVEPVPPALPKTNSTLPLTALIGLLSLSAACLYRGCAGRPNR